MKKPMTIEGHKRLAREYDDLRFRERPKVVQGVATAAAEGDRSENAEYIYGKKRLREIDKRLQYLWSLLDKVELIDWRTLSGKRVVFASTVRLEREDGNVRDWTIVGEGEADAQQGSISWKTPLARAVLGKAVGDTIQLHLDESEHDYDIIDVFFRAPPGSDPVA